MQTFLFCVFISCIVFIFGFIIGQVCYSVDQKEKDIDFSKKNSISNDVVKMRRPLFDDNRFKVLHSEIEKETLINFLSNLDTKKIWIDRDCKDGIPFSGHVAVWYGDRFMYDYACSSQTEANEFVKKINNIIKGD